MNNQTQHIKCFTDASYSQQKSLSVVGYKISNLPIKLEILQDIKNTQAELHAVNKCIDESKIMFPNRNIIIYTDCQRAIKSFSEEEYPSFVTIEKIKGHIKTELRNDNDKVFNMVDKAVRRKLRSI